MRARAKRHFRCCMSDSPQMGERKAHRRRVTKGLNTNQVKELNGAWHHATRIGRPLNVLISVRPPGFTHDLGVR